MRKPILLCALLGSLGLLLPGRAAAQSQNQSFQVGPAVLPNQSQPQMKNLPPSNATPLLAPLKKVAQFLSTPIIQVGAFMGIRQGESTTIQELKRERMYRERKEQYREELMKTRTPTGR